MKLRVAFGLVLLSVAVVVPAAAAKPVRLDPSFGEGGIFVRPPDPEQFSQATDMAIAPDGRIIVVGQRYAGGPTAPQSAFGFTADGQIDSTFGASGPGVTDFLDNDEGAPHLLGFDHGRALIATLAREPADYGLPPILRLIRLLPDGSLDPTFGTNGIVRTHVGTYGGMYATRMADGRIVVAMTGATDPGSDYENVLVARLLPNGDMDESFSGDGKAYISDPRADRTSEGPLVVLKNGAIVVAGGVSTTRGRDLHSRSALFKVNSEGMLQKRFGVGGFARVPKNRSFIEDFAAGPHGRFVGVGTAAVDSRGVDYRPEVTAFRANGSLERRFGKRGVATLPAAHLGGLISVVVRPGGSLLAAGNGNVTPFDSEGTDGGDDGDFLLARLTARGKPDRNFARKGVVLTDVQHGSDRLDAIGIRGGGRIVAAGTHGYYSFRGPTNQQVTLAAYRR
jgi:uncharacterized delta-60 repeat protein